LSIFITFEGGEGSGKSTQAEALAKRLRSLGIPVLLTHEPGGTPMGEQIKEWLKGKDAKGKKNSAEVHLDPQTELLLFNAARAQLVSKVIRPALENDTVVICDRFYHSTIAYQGHGRGLDLELVESVIELATDGLKPNLTILMDIDVQKGLARKDLLDRFEREEIDFHQRVRQSYLGMAHQNPQHWLVVNASLNQKEVEQLIWDWVEQLLPAMRRIAEGETVKEFATPEEEKAEIPISQEEESAAEAPAPVIESVEEAILSLQEESVEGEAMAAPEDIAAITGPIAEEVAPAATAAEEKKSKKKAKSPKKKAAAKPAKDTKKKVAKKKEK
jgi:dTMP kinase